MAKILQICPAPAWMAAHYAATRYDGDKHSPDFAVPIACLALVEAVDPHTGEMLTEVRAMTSPGRDCGDAMDFADNRGNFEGIGYLPAASYIKHEA